MHMFLRGFYTHNWNAACVSAGECTMCTCFCVGFIRLIEKLLVCPWENVSFAIVLRRVFIRLLEMLLVCLWENVSHAHVFAWVLYA